MGAGGLSLKAGLTGCVGGSLAALGYLHTGMVAAVPAATGLAALAASDLTSHRFSLRTLRAASALVAAGLLVDTSRAAAWDRLAVAAALTVLIAVALAGAWLGTHGIAFGDVLLTSFAVAVPAWLSPRAAAVTVFVGVVAAAPLVLVRRVGAGDGTGSPVAFGPALLAGWVVAMVVG
jgi:leader peptidase (prepilin peptidase)/N-methyltransferase